MANVLISYKYWGIEEIPNHTGINSEYNRVWLNGSEEINESEATKRISILEKITNEFGDKVYKDITYKKI